MHATFKQTSMMHSEKSGDSEADICHPFPKKRKTDCANNQFLKKGLLLPHKCGEHVLNPLNAELNPFDHLLAFLGTHPILHVSRIRVNKLFLNKTKL